MTCAACLTADNLSMVGYGPPVVFLCDTPTTAITDRELEIFRERQPDHPIVSKRWRSHTDEPLAKFTVRLPSNDRNLKRYLPWLRGHPFDGGPDPDDGFMVRVIDTWWIDVGEIAPSKIIECIIDPATSMKTAS